MNLSLCMRYINMGSVQTAGLVMRHTRLSRKPCLITLRRENSSAKPKSECHNKQDVVAESVIQP